MSDTTLRSLERRAHESGTIEDRAALLRARLRAGTLIRERLELAALVGDKASRLAVGGDPVTQWWVADSFHLSAWIDSIKGHARPLPDIPGRGEPCSGTDCDEPRVSQPSEPQSAPASSHGP